MGVTRRLKELNPAIQCISMQPDGPLHGLEGLKHMPTALVPGIYDAEIADGQIEVREGACVSMKAIGAGRILVGVPGGNWWRR
jgi:cysteine synthase B